MRRYKFHKSQEMLTYAALIVFVIVALIIMFGYIKNRIMGSYQQAGDAIGEGEQKD